MISVCVEFDPGGGEGGRGTGELRQLSSPRDVDYKFPTHDTVGECVCDSGEGGGGGAEVQGRSAVWF